MPVFDPSRLSEEKREEIGAFGLAAMAGIEEEPIDHVLYFWSIPEERRIEFRTVLNPFHMEEVVLGGASPRAAGNMFRDGFQTSKALYKDDSEWETWLEEQERMANMFFSAMKYRLAREQYGTDAVLSPTADVHLATTDKRLKLGPGPYDTVVPASPECYQPWMNWVASEWMLFRAGLRRECAVNVFLLGPRPKIRKDDAAEEVRYQARVLAEKLTSKENTNWTRYNVRRRSVGKYQTPKHLREDIALALPIGSASVHRYLEAAGFRLRPYLNRPPLAG